MTERSALPRICVGLLLASGALVSAQQVQLPSEPARQFGASITGAFEGWFRNPDGSYTFLVGYLNRNRAEEENVPIGPNNRIEPGGPDLGQPTHFLPGRQTGMFTVTVPKEFTPQQRLTWTITLNGQTNSIPLASTPITIVSPFSDLAVKNTLPCCASAKVGTIQGPIASLSKPGLSATPLAMPLLLPLWAEDDAKYSSGTNAPMRNPLPPVQLTWSQHAGPGTFVLRNPSRRWKTGWRRRGTNRFVEKPKPAPSSARQGALPARHRQRLLGRGRRRRGVLLDDGAGELGDASSAGAGRPLGSQLTVNS